LDLPNFENVVAPLDGGWSWRQKKLVGDSGRRHDSMVLRRRLKFWSLRIRGTGSEQVDKKIKGITD